MKPLQTYSGAQRSPGRKVLPKVAASTNARIWNQLGPEISFYTSVPTTVTSFPPVEAGTFRILQCSAGITFTNSTKFVVQGGTYTTVANDIVWVHAIDTGFILTVAKASSASVQTAYAVSLL